MGQWPKLSGIWFEIIEVMGSLAVCLLDAVFFSIAGGLLLAPLHGAPGQKRIRL